MRTLILGDIHGNLEAFQAVLEHAGRQGGFQQLWCLGDVVGYGPDPGACIDLLRQHPHAAVAGNHDRAAVGLLPLDDFNDYAATACRWTARNLSSEQAAYLQGLPLVHREGEFTLVHGSLRHPVWEYLLNQEAATATFGLLETSRCLVAHSHIPFVCRENQGQPTFHPMADEVGVTLERERLIINPGSVGQPRDGDSRASYALFDAGTITLNRVQYDIQAVQEKMRLAGLPEPLASRLAVGR